MNREKTSLVDEDRQLFAGEVADAVPLKAKGQRRCVIHSRPSMPSLAQQARRQAAQQEPLTDPNFLSDTGVQPVDGFAVVEFCRPGVQQGVYRKLRLGKYPAEARLDLHRLTVEQAREALWEFMADCLRLNLRTVMVLHGKGLHRGAARASQMATIKSHTVHWLQQFPEVLAFHSCQPQHGGGGGLYVLLKKGESARTRNREQYR